jgi:hypothetical protein
MKKLLLSSLCLIVSLMPNHQVIALTFKTGEVLGPDGKVYKGMSAQSKANLVVNNKAGEIESGIYGNSFYRMVNDIVTTILLADLIKKNLKSS